MEDLFRQFWWLIFPLVAFVAAGFGSWLRYRRHKATLDVIRTYAEKGQQPPPELLQALRSTEGDDDGWGGTRRPTNYWSLVGLFGVMAAGFGGAAFYYGVEGGPGFAFTIVAFVMGAVGVWALISALTTRRGG